MSSFSFNAVLLEISNQLSADQLEQIKFLCADQVGKREREQITTGRRLFQVLTERGQLGVHNTDYLSRILTKIHRPDLADALTREHSEEGSDNQPDEAEKGAV